MGPLIGIPPCLDERGRWRNGRRYHYLDCGYAEALTSAGAVAVYLPQAGEPDALVARLDGLLLPGGDDFLPEGPPPPGVRFEPVPEEQLAFDAALLAAALARGLPVLGICYGMQLLARQHGGSLVYDLPSERPEAGPHRLPEREGRHGLRLEPGSRLAAALAGQPPRVNSLHHQGVSEPGHGLRVSARAEDGVIEGIEAPDRRFVVGVQWHPEKMDAAHRQALFGAFVEACRGGSEPS